MLQIPYNTVGTFLNYIQRFFILFLPFYLVFYIFMNYIDIKISLFMQLRMELLIHSSYSFYLRIRSIFSFYVEQQL